MSLRQWIFADLLSEKFTQGVREIHASLARLSLSGICGILVFSLSCFCFLWFFLTFPSPRSCLLHFSHSVSCRHSALRRGIQVTFWRHTLYRIGVRDPGEKTKPTYTVAAFWIPLFSGMTT